MFVHSYARDLRGSYFFSRHGRYVVPLLSVHINFYVRLCVRIYSSKEKAREFAERIRRENPPREFAERIRRDLC